LVTMVKNRRLYEGLFLVDSALASADWDAIIKAITTMLEKAEVEIVSIKKWDDRKLAYDIRGVSRGVYILCYFRADGGKIQSIERDVHLSEQIMRALILRADHLTQEDIDGKTPVGASKKEDIERSEQTLEAGGTKEEDKEVSEGTDEQQGKAGTGGEESGIDDAVEAVEQ